MSPGAISRSTKYVHPTGTVVIVGMHPGGDMQIPVLDVVLRSIIVIASYVCNGVDTKEAIDTFLFGLESSSIKIAGLS